MATDTFNSIRSKTFLVASHARSAPILGSLFKRLFDLVCSALGLLFLGPVFLLIALRIKRAELWSGLLPQRAPRS